MKRWSAILVVLAIVLFVARMVPGFYATGELGSANWAGRRLRRRAAIGSQRAVIGGQKPEGRKTGVAWRSQAHRGGGSGAARSNFGWPETGATVMRPLREQVAAVLP